MRRSELIWEHLAAFAAGRPGDPHVWCNLPRLGSTAYIHMTDRHHVPGPLARMELRRLRRTQVAARGRGPGRGTTVLVGDRCLFVGSAANQQGAQAPLHARFGPLRPPDPGIASSRRQARRLARDATSVARELIACARRRAIEYPLDSGLICHQLARAGRLLGYWEELLAREAPRVVVVASLWSPPARTLIHAARRAGIATVHVPDAALRADWRRPGLPVDYVALRGPREAAQVGRQPGVDRERLDVVGHPALTPTSAPDVDASLPPVLATSSEKQSQLAPLVELMWRALGPDAILARHPNPAADCGPRAFPEQWQAFEGATIDLLRRGPPLVVQQSSGVALESMHLGIPVIELRHPGKASHFPWIREPYVRFASSSEELRAAVCRCRAQASDPAHRAALVAWAREWAWPAGEPAADRAIALVERAMADGPRGPIWDPW